MRTDKPRPVSVSTFDESGQCCTKISNAKDSVLLSNAKTLVLLSGAEMIGYNWRRHNNVATGNVIFTDVHL